MSIVKTILYKPTNPSLYNLHTDKMKIKRKKYCKYTKINCELRKTLVSKQKQKDFFVHFSFIIFLYFSYYYDFFALFFDNQTLRHTHVYGLSWSHTL